MLIVKELHLTTLPNINGANWSAQNQLLVYF